MGSRRGVLSGLHIVVVEDNPDARDILGTVLEYFGAMVTSSESGRQGLTALRQVAADLVLADMQLGDHNAIWLLREARKVNCTAPFILVSGVDFDDQQALAQGFEFFLRKPVDHDRLVDTVLAAVRRR